MIEPDPLEYAVEPLLEEVRNSAREFDLKRRRALKKDETAGEWIESAFPEPPEPLESYPQPPFPIEVLPEIGRDMVMAVARSTDTSPDLGAMMFLGVLSLALAKKVKVCVRPDWVESVNLYVMVGALSGERKSSVHRPITEPVYQFEDEERQRSRVEVAKLIAKRESLEHEYAEAQRQAGKTVVKPEDREQWEAKARDLKLELEQLPMAIMPLYLTENATTEAIVSLLATHGRMAVVSTEGAEIFEIMAGRYNPSPNFGIYLQAYTGDPVTVHRRA